MANKVSTCPTPAGILLIIGGHEGKIDQVSQNHDQPEGYDPLTISKTFAELIENKTAPVEIVTTGTSEGKGIILFNDSPFTNCLLYKFFESKGQVETRPVGDCYVI